MSGRLPGDVWSDINALQIILRLGYPTQKPEALLERIVKASSNEGSIVLDCFMGSGTTQAVAQKLGRKWIGIDCNKDSIETVKKRFLKKFNISL
jgi:DNA modification methylase